jgi:membrane-bound ClpP family serine protease
LILTFVGDLSVPGVWSLNSTWDDLQRGLYTVTGSLLASLLLFAWLRKFLPALPYFNRLVLTTTSGTQPTSAMHVTRTTDVDPMTDHWPFVGTIGVATTDLRPGGKARFPYGADIRITDVISEAGYVTAGTKLQVHEIEGVRVVVRPVTSSVED